MTTMSMVKRLVVASAATAALFATTVTGPAAPASAQTVKGYPSVKVVDLKTGKTVNLATNNTTKLPTLAWFWAPH
jgi:hypothetical protein